jgi:hypothetical protein
VPSNRLLVALAAAIAAIVVAVIVIVRVTGDDDFGSAETAAWAGSVCSTVAEWRSAITSLADLSSGTLSRDTLREGLDDAQEATETLLRELRDLGPPDTEAGNELEAELDAATDELEERYENLKAGAEEALETEGTTDFLRALADLAPDVQGLLTSVSTMIDSLQNSDVAGESSDEVRDAFENSEQCQELRSDED